MGVFEFSTLSAICVGYWVLIELQARSVMFLHGRKKRVRDVTYRRQKAGQGILKKEDRAALADHTKVVVPVA